MKVVYCFVIQFPDELIENNDHLCLSYCDLFSTNVASYAVLSFLIQMIENKYLLICLLFLKFKL
jgi:hypothetical protein